MAIPKYNIKIKANGCWAETWQIKNNGQPFDITGFDFELEVKKAKGFTQPKFLDLKVGSGITIVDASLGKILIEIEPQPEISSPTTYVYDLIMIQNGCPQVLIEGSIEFQPGVSYIGD